MTYLRSITYLLGFCIMRNLEAGIMSLIQETYLFKILERFKMKDAKRVDPPIAKKDILIHSNPSYYADPSTVT